uniref:Disease resistance protein n=2 Tax=Glycine max TaxID=3847 RepID=Q6R270_SOYBN|nr:disease resistance protein [Glycine max]
MALELVGGALLSAFLQVAFEKLASPQVLDFFRGRKLDQKLLNNLETKLNSIQALADDAELKQFRDERVRDWLLKVKDAVFDAEDLLDEIQHEISKCQVEAESQTCSGCTCKVPNFFKSSPVSSFNREIKSRMEQVLEDLENLASQSGYLGLKNASGVGSGGAVSQQSQSTSLLVESVIYGRDDDKEMIFNWLTSDIDNCNKLSILPIVGMGGLGKTTLAQHVFNDPRIENKFDIKAWVCVSDEFDVFNVTRTILEAVTKSTDDSRNREMVQGRLREKLTGKRFFLVLDDVWNRNQKEWKDLQTPLNDGASGSKIVITTRDKKVASVVGSNKTHCLELLQDDHCWRLFTKHAFRDDSHQPNPDFKEIGTKIVEKCKGLPLALTTIGSLLHQKSSISEWEGILKSEIWEFSEEDSSIIPALALSYHHLPSRLKRCFAYCALFPKDYRFEKEGLIQLWMAENFLQCPQQSRSPEEVGEPYFNDLLSRSFFQQSSTIERTPFVMHDLLNDLAKYVCRDICFRLEDDQAKNIPKTTRHFSVASDHVKWFDGFGTLYNAERLRTFMSLSEEMSFRNYNRWHCKMSTRELFSKFKFLRILSLSGYSNLTELPDSVGNLKYLHSLDLSNTDIEKLPESTCSLYNLQILKLNGCRHLKELPSNLHKLTDLHRLELIDTGVRKVPAHLGKLKYLQVLMSSFNVGKSREFSIQQLGELNLHGSLSIENLQNVENPSDALAVDLKNKTHLVELELKWDSDWNQNRERDEIVIENLQPSKHLEKLTMRNYGGKQFPSWLSDNSSCNVVSLTLENCQSCQRLPPLGLLPFLKELSIRWLDGIVSINADFFGSSSCSFTSLESLEFSDMKEWEEWECKGVTGAFPRLQRLFIVRCPKLKGLPPLGLLPFLKELLIERLDGIVSINADFFGSSSCSFTSLESLKFFDMKEWEEWECKGVTGAFPRLQHLSIVRCPKLKGLPPLGLLPFLKELSIDSLDGIVSINADFFGSSSCLFTSLESLKFSRMKEWEEWECKGVTGDFPRLQRLSIYYCPKLKGLPPLGLLPFLKELSIDNLDGIVSINADFFGSSSCSFTSLESLKFSDMKGWEEWECKGVTGAFPRLQRLSIYYCPKLKGLPPLGLLPFLKELSIDNLDGIVSINADFFGSSSCSFTSLESLKFSDMKEWEEWECKGVTGAFPRLQRLSIYRCPKLKGHLPEQLCHLNDLTISGCDSLTTIPLDIFPILRELDIRKCPNLQRISQGHTHNHLQRLSIKECPQ